MDRTDWMDADELMAAVRLRILEAGRPPAPKAAQTPNQILWQHVACSFSKAPVGSVCVDPKGARFTVDRSDRPHPTRAHTAEKANAVEQRRRWEVSPEGLAHAERLAVARDVRMREYDAERKRDDAERERRRKQDERRDEKRERGGYNWSEEDPVGKKRQRLVTWLMTQGVDLGKAKLIACRKYRY